MSERATKAMRLIAVVSCTLAGIHGAGTVLELIGLGGLKGLVALLAIPLCVIWWRAIDPLLTTEAELRLAVDLAASGRRVKEDWIAAGKAPTGQQWRDNQFRLR